MTLSGETDFSIHNLPFGVFETDGGGPRAGIAIGAHIVDLAQLAAQGYFDDLKITDPSVFSQDSLNAFIALGKPYWRAVRQRVATFLTSNSPHVEQQAAKMLPGACLFHFSSLPRPDSTDCHRKKIAEELGGALKRYGGVYQEPESE